MNEEFNWLYYLLPLSSLLSDFIKKKESSRPISRVLCLLPKRGKGVCHLSTPSVTDMALASYPPARAGYPQTPVYMLLQLPRQTARCVTTRLVSSYLTFSPLPLRKRRLFSSPLLNPHGLLAVNKWDALCCPDFPLSPPERGASDKPSDCFRGAKVRKLLQNSVLFL